MLPLAHESPMRLPAIELLLPISWEARLPLSCLTKQVRFFCALLKGIEALDGQLPKNSFTEPRTKHSLERYSLPSFCVLCDWVHATDLTEMNWASCRRERIGLCLAKPFNVDCRPTQDGASICGRTSRFCL